MVLQLVVKAMNDTTEPDGLVPSYLFFECIPRFPAVDSTVLNQKDCTNTLENAGNEMATRAAELGLKTALASRVLRNADLLMAAGDIVRVFRETKKCCVGIFSIVQVEDKQVFVLQP